MKKRFMAMVLCCVVMAGTGCAGTSVNPAHPAPEQGTEESADSAIQDGTEKPDGQDTSGGQEEKKVLKLDKVAINDAYDKAAYFLDVTYKSGSSKNTMVSPLSLDMALGLVSGGAEGKTKEEIASYLSKEDYGKYASDYLGYTEQLNVDYGDNEIGGYRTMFEIANSVWVSDDRELISAYADKAKADYRAEIASVSFAPQNKSETANRINGWCDEKTHGLIPSVITEDVLKETLAMILINSLYFEAPWIEPWSVDRDKFTALDGTESTQDMLKDMLSVYYENDKATAFSKPYMNGLEFIGVLPKQTGDFEVQDLDIESLLNSRNLDVDVHAMMPKLNFETMADRIVPMLQSQGMETPFDESAADFSGLVQMRPGENTYISDIMQKCKIELDENGTKAAAVTLVMMECAAAAPMDREEKEVYLNRPFAFMIYDRENDQIVFIGKVVNLDS